VKTLRPCAKRRSSSCSCSGAQMQRFMEPCLILLLLEKPSHGYELISRLQDFGFKDNQDPGMVYRALRRLEKQGVIRSHWDTLSSGPARRSYEVTYEGREALMAWIEKICANIKVLKSFLSRCEKLKL